MPGRVSTDRWTLEVPDGWTAGEPGEPLQLVPPDATAQVFVSDLRLDLTNADGELVAGAVRTLLDATSAGERVQEAPTEVEAGHFLALGYGTAAGSFVSVAAHAWPGAVLLLTLHHLGEDRRVREQARTMFASVRRTEATGADTEPDEADAADVAPDEASSKSIVGRLFRR